MTRYRSEDGMSMLIGRRRPTHGPKESTSRSSKPHAFFSIVAGGDMPAAEQRLPRKSE